MTIRDEDRKTRRTVLRAGLAAIGGAAAAAAEAQTQARAGQRIAQEKIAQQVVQYQDTPKNNQICSACVNFEPPAACKIVVGTINPNGWCIAFAPKAS